MSDDAGDAPAPPAPKQKVVRVDDIVEGDPAAQLLNSTDQLRVLTAQLEAAQQQTAQQPERGGDDVLFGLSFGALMVGLVLSTLGICFFRYARIEGQWSFAILGAVLFLLPFAISDSVLLAAAGGGALALTFVIRRFVTF